MAALESNHDVVAERVGDRTELVRLLRRLFKSGCIQSWHPASGVEIHSGDPRFPLHLRKRADSSNLISFCMEHTFPRFPLRPSLCCGVMARSRRRILRSASLQSQKSVDEPSFAVFWVRCSFSPIGTNLSKDEAKEKLLLRGIVNLIFSLDEFSPLQSISPGQSGIYERESREETPFSGIFPIIISTILTKLTIPFCCCTFFVG